MQVAARKPLRLTRPEPTEAQVQRAVLRALTLHPRVSWVRRMNSGVFRPKYDDGTIGFVRAGFVGLSDVIGQMKDGRFLACECKRPSGRLSGPQSDFLDAVKGSGGVAFCARSVDDVFSALADA